MASNLGRIASSLSFKISGVISLATSGSELASALNGAAFRFGGNDIAKSLVVFVACSSLNYNNTA